MPAGFDALLAEMDDVVEECRARSSRAGYFAALYRAVTRSVRDQAAEGHFDDAGRMSAFADIFARRYLDAFGAWRAGRPTTASWAAAFAAADRWPPIVVQHLMLGMNAHINLDLGVVTAELADRAGGLDAVESDFNRVNDVLAAMVEASQRAVVSVSPWVGLLDRAGGRTDTRIIRFSLVQARQAAWRSARRLAPLPPPARAEAVEVLDRDVARLAALVTDAPFRLDAALFVVRLRERKTVSEVIDALSTI